MSKTTIKTISIPVVLTLIMLLLTAYNSYWTKAAESTDAIDAISSDLKTHVAVAAQKEIQNGNEHEEFKEGVADINNLLDSLIMVNVRKVIIDSIQDAEQSRKLDAILARMNK